MIIPYYKNHNLLIRCLDSIKNQKKYLDITEVILINDNPNDISEIKHQLKNITLIKNRRNLGPGLSRNKGINIAKGKYLIFIDSDDFIKNNYLKEIYLFVFNKNYDVITLNKKKINNFNKNIIMENYISASIDTSVIYSIFNKSFLLDNKILFKRGLHEDILFMYKVYLFSKKSLFINNNFYVKENRINSIVNTISKKRIKDYYHSFYEVIQNFKKTDIYIKNPGKYDNLIKTGGSGYFYEITKNILIQKHTIYEKNILLRYSFNLFNKLFEIKYLPKVTKKDNFNYIFLKKFIMNKQISSKNLKFFKEQL